MFLNYSGKKVTTTSRMTGNGKNVESKTIDVLIVGDDLVNQELLSSYLLEYDVTFKIVKSGSLAIEALEQSQFRLLILDIELFELMGCELTKHLRNEMAIHIPIVAITNYSLEFIKKKCFDAGMNACFSKPISKIELVGILTQFLS